MGFFDELVKFVSSPGGGLLTTGLLSGGAALLGSNQQSDAIRDASRIASGEQAIIADQLSRERASQEARFLTLLDFANLMREEEAPFRDISLKRAQFGNEFLPTIRETVDNPTLSPGFQLAAKEGINLLRRNFSRTNSPSGGPAQIATGRFLEGLTSRELDRFNENLFKSAGFTGAPVQSQGTGIASQAMGSLLPSAVAPPTQGANFALQQGQNTANLFSNIGKTISQLPLQSSLMAYLNRK